MQDTVGAQRVKTKTRVFISYSRKDMAFADKLEAALKARGVDIFIDREDIYAFEPWWERVQKLISQATRSYSCSAPTRYRPALSRSKKSNTRRR